jgi:hypothetical protein
MGRLIILFFFIPVVLFSQNISELENKLQDNAHKDELNCDADYIFSYREKLTIKTDLT